MTMQTRRWAATTDEQWQSWGNARVTVTGTEPGLFGQLAWEGWAAGWQENGTPGGSLTLFRRVELEEGRIMNLPCALIAAGHWLDVDADRYLYDLEAVHEEESRQEQALREQAEAEAAARLGVMNRSQRRH